MLHSDVQRFTSLPAKNACASFTDNHGPRLTARDPSALFFESVMHLSFATCHAPPFEDALHIATELCPALPNQRSCSSPSGAGFETVTQVGPARPLIPGSPGSAGACVSAVIARSGPGGEVARASGSVRGLRQVRNLGGPIPAPGLRSRGAASIRHTSTV
jgi:hypothetical protein